MLRGDRAQGLSDSLAADLLRTQRERERVLSDSVRARLRGDARTLAQKDGGSAVRPGFLRNRLRQALFPRDLTLRDTGDDTEDTFAEGTAAAGHAVRATALLPGAAGNRQ